MTSVQEQLLAQGRQAKQAARVLASMPSGKKNEALWHMATALKTKTSEILEANARDMEAARKKGLSKPMLDRLLLTENRIEEMAEGLRALIDLPDPVGEVVGMWKRPNGLEIGRVRVPLGVVGIIYEARPNVTVDAAGLCLKTGNAVILRGGSEAFNSNRMLTDIIAGAAQSSDMPAGCIQLVNTTDREAATMMMKMNGYIDVLIPRGGAGLIRSVVENATVPVIETGVGNCHVYVDECADLKMAEEIVFNAKVQRPSVCNAAESLLVHRRVASDFLPAMVKRLAAAGVEVRGCEQTRQIVPGVVPATEEDFATEFLDLIIAVKIVDSLDEAIEHIHRYGSGHTEAIVTESYSNSRRFLAEVDAACVIVNASTRFTDGHQFGLGAEIGISTQKLHARGPMGLVELTTTKYIVYGSGQIRQ